MHPSHRPIAASAAVLLAVATLAGCDIKVSDRDLLPLDPPAAVDQMHARAGLFEKQTVGCWVDPRSAEAYAKGHIKGAIHLPLVQIPEAAAARLAPYNLYIVYGDGFQDPLAKAAAKKLLEVGFKKGTVYMMEGGLRAWEKDGYSIVTGTAPDGGDLPKQEARPAGKGTEVPEKGVR